MSLVTRYGSAFGAEDLLRLFVGGAGAATGEEFFRLLVRDLATALGFRDAMLGELVDGEPCRVRTLAMFTRGAYADNVEYEIGGSPCAEVVARSFAYYPGGVADLFPRDRYLAEQGLESYAGVALHDPDGVPVGLLVAQHDRPTDAADGVRDVLGVFAARAAAEVRRLRTERALREARETLEDRVRERTAELARVATELSRANAALSREVAERRAAERALHQTQRRYEGLLNGPQTLIARSDPSGRLTYVNHAFAAAFGVGLGDKFIERVHPDDERTLDDALAGLAFPPHTIVAEQRWRVGDHWRWILWQASGVLDEDGRVAEVQGVGFDVTDRRRAADELRAVTSRVPCILWRATAAGLPGWEQDVDGQGLRLRWDFRIVDEEAAQRLLPIDVPAGQRYHEAWRVSHPEDRAMILATMARTLIEGRRSCQREFRCRDRDGRLHWLHEEVAVEPQGPGRWELFGVVTDVTDRKQAVEALRESDRRYAHAARAGRTGVWEWDVVNDRLYLSPTIKAMLGYGPDDLQVDRLTWRRYLHPDDVPRVLEVTQAHLDGRTPGYELEVRRRHRDGTYRWFLSRAGATRDESGRAVLVTGSLTDIMELKQAQEAIAHAAESNRRLLQELDHRVRNNLAGLQSLVSLMRDRVTDVDAFAAAIDARLRAMAHVHELLSETRWRDIDLDSLVRSLLRRLRDTARHPETPVAADGPAVRLPARHALPLTLILAELFTNSVKYGAHAVPTGRVSLTWDLREPTGGRAATTAAPGPQRTLTLRWRESGGPPPVTPCPTPSLGTELIRSFSTRELAGSCSLSYPPTGADHVLSFPCD